jgi:hypothetical protein
MAIHSLAKDKTPRNTGLTQTHTKDKQLLQTCDALLNYFVITDGPYGIFIFLCSKYVVFIGCSQKNRSWESWQMFRTEEYKIQRPVSPAVQHVFTVLCLQYLLTVWTNMTFCLSLNDIFKGTVSRDFSCPVFFIKELFLVPIGKPRNDFDFFRIFVELFVFIIDSPVMNTPGSRLESLRLCNFCKHKSHVPKELK